VLLTFDDYLQFTDSNTVMGQHLDLFHDHPPIEVSV
jgi:hypothetical protein